MNETTVTVVGTVCSDIRYGQTTDATPTARFQIRQTPRRYDRRTSTWTDGDPSYFTATCFRSLADHVASSMGVGDPVVATGRLRISRWRRGEENMISAELDVHAIGHDLRWGTTVYRRSTPPGTTPRIPGPPRRREDEALAGAAGSVSGAPGESRTPGLDLASAGSGTAVAAAEAYTPNTDSTTSPLPPITTDAVSPTPPGTDVANPAPPTKVDAMKLPAAA